MEVLSHSDLLFLKFGLAGASLAYAGSLSKRLLNPQKSSPPSLYSTVGKASATLSLPPTRSIKKRLEQTGKRCIIFYGTQTGTAEKFAIRLGKELSTRFNLQSMPADLDDYDFADLSSLGSDYIAIFLVATYGEGEPTDNAITFDNFLKAQAGSSSPLSLQYAAFGLGNSSYTFYNSMVTRVDALLQQTGAQRIGDVGLGDDGKGTLEEDFVEWKDKTMTAIAQQFHLQEQEYQFTPTFDIVESSAQVNANVFLGEPNKAQLKNRVSGPFTARNPFPAKIVEAKELFNSKDRNCVHLEFDISNTTVRYETGDHLAVWPVNSDVEVDRFLDTFGLREKKDTVVGITSRDLTVKVPIPTKTTYEAAARYYLDICGPVSRQVLSALAAFAPPAAQAELHRLSSDSAAFQREVTDRQLTLSQALAILSPGSSWAAVPFAFLLENVARLQPRYYSISSSSMASNNRISITCVVDSRTFRDSPFTFKGVSTHYLMALKNSATVEQNNTAITHRVSGPRGRFAESTTALIHVRRSKFRLPCDPSTPVIMIGPGTGVAPFRAFVQERALAYRANRNIGPTVLFYGCRRRDEDFLYYDEWKVCLFSPVSIDLPTNS